MPQPVQEKLLADRARQAGEERHGACLAGGSFGGGRGETSGYRCFGKGSMCEEIYCVGASRIVYTRSGHSRSEQGS